MWVSHISGLDLSAQRTFNTNWHGYVYIFVCVCVNSSVMVAFSLDVRELLAAGTCLLAAWLDSLV